MQAKKRLLINDQKKSPDKSQHKMSTTMNGWASADESPQPVS